MTRLSLEKSIFLDQALFVYSLHRNFIKPTKISFKIHHFLILPFTCNTNSSCILSSLNFKYCVIVIGSCACELLKVLHHRYCEVINLTRLRLPRYLVVLLFLACLRTTTNTVKAFWPGLARKTLRCKSKNTKDERTRKLELRFKIAC